MSAFAANLLLALVWAALMGRFDVPNLAFGFLLGFFFLAVTRAVPGSARYAGRVPRLLSLLSFFAWELLVSNLEVAVEVVSPRPRRRPGIVRVPLDAETDVEITLLACLITLTPGTLTLEVSEDRKSLVVHAMFLDDPERLVRSIKDGFERRVLEVMR
jgi:multicomponent Na+:H+ antiporter subunit E